MMTYIACLQCSRCRHITVCMYIQLCTTYFKFLKYIHAVICYKSLVQVLLYIPIYTLFRKKEVCAQFFDLEKGFKFCYVYVKKKTQVVFIRWQKSLQILNTHPYIHFEIVKRIKIRAWILVSHKEEEN